MGVEELARRLADEKRIGLNAELVKKLKLKSADVTRGQLMAQLEGKRGHVGVYLLSVHVVDDTDLLGKGEIYWWCIPVLGDNDGKVSWGPLCSLPSAAAPVKTGSGEWMKSPSLDKPTLLALVPPSDDIAACILRIGLYDDDGQRADVPRAMTEALEALAEIPADAPQPNVEAIVNPVRSALWKALRAQQDDLLLEKELKLLRGGGATRFESGMIGSLLSPLASLYYFVRDETATEQLGPVPLVKGQDHTVKFAQPFKRGGRLALFARGGEVHTECFGTLTTETPFQNRIIDAAAESNLKNGFRVEAKANAELIAFYTP
jgi:hypothetical protein